MWCVDKIPIHIVKINIKKKKKKESGLCVFPSKGNFTSEQKALKMYQQIVIRMQAKFCLSL